MQKNQLEKSIFQHTINMFPAYSFWVSLRFWSGKKKKKKKQQKTKMMMMMMMMSSSMSMSMSFSATSSPVFSPSRSFMRDHPHRPPRLSNRPKLRAPARLWIPLVFSTPSATVSRISCTSIKLDKENVADKDEGKESHGFLRKRFAVFASGGGSNFQTIHKASMENKIYGDISVVVSDKPGGLSFF